jgi:serine/threonine-protein kinase SRPK3
MTAEFLGGPRPGIPAYSRISLDKRENTLNGGDKDDFFRLMRKMLQWEPGKRSSAKDLVGDEWICKNL